MTALVFLICVAVFASVSAEKAEQCLAANCSLPVCQCSGARPVVEGNIPQLVALSFDDSVSKLSWDTFYEPELLPRKNPDGCPISGTFFVPHEYTDYTVVNKLYNNGFEIGSHSITKNYNTLYWNNATSEIIQKEMGGQQTVLSRFANIPKTDITGARIPHFQLNADHTYDGIQNAGFQYDNSWPTYSFRPLSPYTLDYLSEQNCLVGTCPKNEHEGLWVVPINNWKGMDGQECNKLLACVVDNDADDIYNWMVENFERIYKGNRDPVTLSVNVAWFGVFDQSLEAFQRFLDYLTSQEDVFIVSNRQVLDWIQNPVPLEKFSSCQERATSKCTAVNCRLQNEDGNDRYMGSCVTCPKWYPSLDNPLGK